MNQSKNGISPGSVNRYRYPELWTIPSAVTYSCISIIIISGNSLVIASFSSNIKLRTKTYLFFVSLAIADLFIAVVSIPMWMYLLISKDYGNAALSGSYAFFDVMSGLSSIFNLTAISLERWYAITKPIKHRNIPKRRIIFTIFVTWLLSIFFSSLTRYKGNRRMKQIYMFFVTVVLFFVPLGIIAMAYWKIFKAARGKIMNTKRDGNSFKKDLRNAITIGIVIGAFLVCWLPFFILIIITFTGCKTCTFLTDMRIVIVVKMMHYGNSAVNPFIYALRIPEFKKTFSRLINRMLTSRSKQSFPRDTSFDILRKGSTRKTSATSISNSTKKESSALPYSDIYFISAV